ncbi:MAG: TolC family protein [Candidatus Brocadiia bacterium]
MSKAIPRIPARDSYILLYALLVVCMLLPGWGCTSSHSQYYEGLEDRRRRRYSKWEEAEEEHAPKMEGELSIRDAVRFALRHSPSLLAALQVQEESRGRVMESYSAALPEAALSGGYTRLDQIATVDMGPESIPAGDRNNYNVDLDVTQPLYRGGSIPAAIRTARLFSYHGEEEIREAVQETAFEVINAYYTALLESRLVEVEVAARKSARQQLRAARERKGEGMARRYDVLRAEVEVSNIEASLIDARRRKEEAHTELMRALGASQKSEVQLTGDLSRIEKKAPSLEEAVSEAFENRPDLRRATINADMSEEALTEVTARYLPHFSAYYNHNWARPDPHDSTRIDWGDEWQAGIKLDWTLFDGLAREGKLVQRRAELRRARIRISDAEQRAIKNVRDALLELESADKMVETQNLNLERAREAQRLVEEGYREGIDDEIELLDARSALTEARGLYYEALHSQRTAWLALRRATGKLADIRGNVNEHLPVSELREKNNEQ